MIPLKYQDNSDLLIKTKNRFWRDFICGPVVKNPPANARDVGLIPGLGRSHVPWSNLTTVLQQLSAHTTTADTHMPRSVLLDERNCCNRECLPLATTREGPCTAMKTQRSQTLNKD